MYASDSGLYEFRKTNFDNPLVLNATAHINDSY